MAKLSVVYFLFLGVCLLQLTQDVSAIMCYTCLNSNSTTCDKMATCSTGSDECIKVIYKLVNTNVTSTYWGCTSSKYSCLNAYSVLNLTASQIETVEYCNVCNTDHCNSAVAQFASIAMVLSSIILIKVFY